MAQPSETPILPRSGTKSLPEGGVWGGVGLANAAEGCDGAVREPAAAAIRDGLSRTLVSINAYFEPANAKKKRFAACHLGVFHTFVYQKIGTN